MSDPVFHSHMWDNLTPDMQAAIERDLAKAPPLTEEKARRLANLLGLRAGGGGTDATV